LVYPPRRWPHSRSPATSSSPGRPTPRGPAGVSANMKAGGDEPRDVHTVTVTFPTNTKFRLGTVPACTLMNKQIESGKQCPAKSKISSDRGSSAAGRHHPVSCDRQGVRRGREADGRGDSSEKPGADHEGHPATSLGTAALDHNPRPETVFPQAAQAEHSKEGHGHARADHIRQLRQPPVEGEVCLHLLLPVSQRSTDGDGFQELHRLR
jgi:hypothetical protein